MTDRDEGPYEAQLTRLAGALPKEALARVRGEDTIAVAKAVVTEAIVLINQHLIDRERTKVVFARVEALAEKWERWHREGGWTTDLRINALDLRRALRDPEPAPPERIVAAAIQVHGVVWTLPPPARHHILVHAWSTAHWRDGKATPVPDDHMQGFLTSSGRFLDREASLKIARVAGQVGDRIIGGVLTSEDLW